VVLLAAAGALGMPAARAEDPPQPSLVRITIIKTAEAGSGEVAGPGGHTLQNYHPTLIQMLHSTGVVIDDRNHVVTCLGFGWVDLQRGNVRVELVPEPSGAKLRGRLIGVDQSTGVAVLRPEGGRLPKTPLCVECEIRDGATVVAPSVQTEGSAQFEPARILAVGSALAVPAGGWQLTVSRRLPSVAPLLDLQHRVLGLAFAAGQDKEGGPAGQQTFVVPTSQLLTSASKIIESGGDIRTGWLGIYLDPVPGSPGVRIAKVAPAGPAATAGLEAEDILLRCNGSPIRDVRQFIRTVQDSPIGKHIELAVLRRGQVSTLRVPIGTRRPETSPGPVVLKFPEGIAYPEASARSAAGGTGRTATPRPRFGAELVALTRQLAEFLNIPVQAGLLVSSVAPRMPAALAGVQAGDVIVAVDGQPVVEPAALQSRVESRGWGSTLVLRYLRKRVEHVARIHLKPAGRREPRN
jgi:serine protease Do